MSMKSWTEEGYGYPLYNGSNFDNIKSFIIRNKEYTNSAVIEQDILDADDEFDLNDALGDPAPWVVAEIINTIENNGVHFKGYDECGDTYQDAMLGIEPFYPWDSRHVSKEDCNAILKKYAKELGITAEPDYFTAEYFG